MSCHSRFHVIVLGSLLLAAAACSKSSAKPTPPAPVQESAAETPEEAPASDPREEAKTTFRARCVVCHGEKGTGEGPGAAALNPKPRNYTDAAWQASVTDEQLKNTIVGGGASVGKSPLMPASPDLQSKPEVVAELVKIVRSFKSN